MPKTHRRRVRRPRTPAKIVHKTRFLSIRLTPEEYTELEARSKAAGSATVSAHCRQRIIGLFADKCDPLCPVAGAPAANARENWVCFMCNHSNSPRQRVNCAKCGAASRSRARQPSAAKA